MICPATAILKVMKAGTLLLIGIWCVQTVFGQTQLREGVGRASMSDTSWNLPNAGEINRLQRAALQGDATAQFRVAVLYYNGEGVPQDYTEAANWFRKAAELGNARAQKNLGVMYGKGQGVPQSHAEAYVWTNIAAKSGDKDAKIIRDYAARELSPEDLVAAQKRVERLHEEIRLGKVTD